ncbi:hypothetical protein Alches_19230 [Alicyclobacillus hesperidum subsp. aegles]|uniref:YciI family protein n=1 Tax=Alicyclobacillus hesperidum TaxID=89784 RepID=UPI00222A0DCF|nr:YciI family protein [Alicyclobacillus hesperidum]GLG01882.1 hypothetical protein Alches_19230 [Alicyclobacillus hesperidum subsp. aegles]
MRYILFVMDDMTIRSDAELTNGTATSDERAAIDAFNDRLMADGYLLFAGGLGSPNSATVIDNRSGAAVVIDGPSSESKEYVAGIWIIDAPDLSVALRLAADGSRACNRKIQVRQFHSA